jgi:tRNA-dihydrouridine synthase
VDGVLVGRAALGAPWFFREKEAARRAPGAGGTGPLPELQPRVPALPVRFDIMLEHARWFERQWGVDQFRRMRKHLGWYCKGFPRAAALRAAMFQVSSVSDVETAVAAYHARTLAARSGDSEILPEERMAEETAALASRCG